MHNDDLIKFERLLLDTGCSTNAGTSGCAIPIKHRPLGTSAHFAKYNAWSVGDNFLDWYGAESGQGTYQGQVAEGTPAVWTTNVAGQTGHNDLNTYVSADYIITKITLKLRLCL